jgi:digeranylgeranylglycerophospholipid reductase
MKEKRCNILIVGAGPAGSCAAQRVAEAGVNVLMIERKKVIGEPIRCAEFIPKQLLHELNCKKDFIVQPVKNMKSILPDNQMIETPAPGLMINRDVFDQALAQKAKEAGAVIWTDTRALTNDNGYVLAEKNNEHIRIKADIIIGADGPHTRVGRWIGSYNKNVIPAVQARVVLKNPTECTEVYFDKRYFGGYAWLFPKGDVANVGLGIKREINPVNIRKSLNYFLQRLKEQNRITGEVTGYNAGWIPAEFPRKVVKDNIMLVGDAAGQTHPITGAGVAQAVICGHMAGAHAAKAIKKGDPGILKRYEEEWFDLYGDSQQRAYKRRELMEINWDNLDNIIKKCWVAFKEYYKD